jgi:hypothetical protein
LKKKKRIKIIILEFLSYYKAYIKFGRWAPGWVSPRAWTCVLSRHGSCSETASESWWSRCRSCSALCRTWPFLQFELVNYNLHWFTDIQWWTFNIFFNDLTVFNSVGIRSNSVWPFFGLWTCNLNIFFDIWF